MASNTGQVRYGCYVGNIDRSVTLEMLKQVFCQCGTIVDCSLNGRDEDPYRYGFIDFATEDDRARAMKYNGFTLVGRKLKVGVSKGNVGKPEGINSAMNMSHSGASTHNAHPRPNNNSGHINGSGGVGGGVAPGAGLLPQQQMELQILMQLIQQGTVDPRTLPLAQQQLLLSCVAQANGAGAMPTPLPQMPAMNPLGGFPSMMVPPQQPMWGNAMGPRGFPVMTPPAPGMHGRGPHMHRGPANPPPSEETIKLREVQHKQYLEVVRKEAERYEKKLQEKQAKGSRKEDGGPTSNSDDSSASDNDDEKRQHSEKKAMDREEPAAASAPHDGEPKKEEA